MNKREFLNNPIRHTTQICYPYKISLDSFISRVETSLKTFEHNMYHVGLSNQEKHIEEWMEIFLTWSEIENE